MQIRMVLKVIGLFSGGVWLSGRFDPLAEAELVETPFMNSVCDLLIVDGVLIAVTIMLSRGFDQ